ncbi:MAG TPA: three-Cys-motif partner protein TcmP [Cyclobacteriaceae bacterium]
MGAKNEIGLEDHSKAKIELYTKYLSIYLNIIARVEFIDKIFLFDLFAGEGIYENNVKGSALAGIECIKNHYFSNGKKCPNLDVIFNDFGQSKIDPTIKKIDRIKSLIGKEYVPDNVNIEYKEIPYSAIINDVIGRLNKITRSQRALLFIDPWGYKDINPVEIRNLLQNGQTEVLLFLPIYHMYRFADKALTDGDNFPGGKPLEKFLLTLFDDQKPNTNSNLEFIDSLSVQFKSYLQIRYTDTFVIEREKGNFFCLFFFTNNKKGYQKMLEAKWSLDEADGKGFIINENPGQLGFFHVVETDNYLDKVKNYLRENPNTTNIELFEFGLSNRHLPKHTKIVLDKLKSKGILEVNSLDNKPVKGYYIDNNERLVHIKLK